MAGKLSTLGIGLVLFCLSVQVAAQEEDRSLLWELSIGSDVRANFFEAPDGAPQEDVGVGKVELKISGRPSSSWRLFAGLTHWEYYDLDLGSSDRGAMHAKEIITRYSAEEAVFTHKALLISVNREATERPLYEAVRYAWKINVARAKQAEVVLATRLGMIVGAFVAHDWLEATAKNFPDRAHGDGSAGRFGFVGEEAPSDVQRKYVGKRVPKKFRARGAANPIKYTWQ